MILVAEVEEVDVGGVPAFLAHVPGETSVGLVFAVGAADEPPPWRGITHLCEHLVLSDLPRRRYGCNGTVGITTTEFIASGTPEQAGEFVNSVASRLGAVPVDRLNKEVAILRAEAELDAPSGCDLLALRRFGARSYGRVALPEFGLLHLDADRVRTWGAGRFHAGNAALWVTGPDPGCVVDRIEPQRLTAARPKSGALPPPPPSRPSAAPRAFTAPVSGPGVAFLVHETTAVRAALTVLVHELEDELRFERALIYEVGAQWERLQGGLAHVVLAIDAMQDRVDEITRVLHDELERFARSGPRAETLEQFQQAVVNEVRDTDWLRSVTRDRAFGHATGFEAVALGRLHDEIAHLTTEVIAATFRTILRSGLAVVPPDAPSLRLFPHDPPLPPLIPSGLVFHGRGDSRGERLLIGQDLISWWPVGGCDAVVIRRRDCELVIAWPDGDRTLLDADGSMFTVAAADWRRGDRAVELADRFATNAPRIHPRQD